MFCLFLFFLELCKPISAIIINYNHPIILFQTAIVASSFKALELMRVDKGGKGGTIINVSSIVALSHEIGLLPVYAGTKSAILQFSCRLGVSLQMNFSQEPIFTLSFIFQTNLFF